jgi:hypothetical protein
MRSQPDGIGCHHFRRRRTHRPNHARFTRVTPAAVNAGAMFAPLNSRRLRVVLADSRDLDRDEGANELGLYDMGGNVWQWCEDRYDASREDRVRRGGSWDGLGGELPTIHVPRRQ